MIRFLRVAAPLVGACLLVSPALAQQASFPNDIDEARPLPPPGFAPSFLPPSRDPGGTYHTPNQDLAPAEITWHVRAALNVAALGCRDWGESEMVARYNSLLAQERAPLGDAQAGTEALYKARFGKAWQDANDSAMTHLYNFFAEPQAHDGFCAAARDVLRDSATVEPADFPAFAARALPALEAPFLASFATFDAYQVKLARWQSGEGTQLASARSGFVGPAAP